MSDSSKVLVKTPMFALLAAAQLKVRERRRRARVEKEEGIQLNGCRERERGVEMRGNEVLREAEDQDQGQDPPKC